MSIPLGFSGVNTKEVSKQSFLALVSYFTWKDWESYVCRFASSYSFEEELLPYIKQIGLNKHDSAHKENVITNIKPQHLM